MCPVRSVTYVSGRSEELFSMAYAALNDKTGGLLFHTVMNL